ncbi:MAG: DUF1015 domain-containing protein [Nitrospinaceae bacterium]
MVEVVPFTGLLYNPEKIGPQEKVIAPPYDVITPQAQEELYLKSPYNVVRLILGKEFPGDTEQNSRYTRSARDFTEWIDQGILTRDREPGLYVYSQDYRFGDRSLTRTGFFARVKLEDFSTGNICPHEFTLAKAKKDRMRLLIACRANFSPIFGLFSDPRGRIDQKLEDTLRTPPLFTVENGTVSHRFWRLTDGESIRFISRSFEDKKIYIADGHHRYETALAYFKNHGHEVSDAAHVMMFLTNLDSDSMSIFPIHRMVRCPSPFEGQDFLLRVGEVFEMETLAQDTPASRVKTLLEKAGESGIAFCAYLGKGKCYLLRLPDPQRILPFLEPDEPEELKVLDVAQLHAIIIKSFLGIDTKQSGNQQYVSYTTEIGEAMEKVDSGDCDLAFFMNPTKISQVRRLAENGIRLPQKATFFYPKLLSGLVINRFES